MGGPDLWTYEVLNNLPLEAVEEIRQLLHDMERQPEVPIQFALHTVCLLAKSSTAERPISLTHVLGTIGDMDQGVQAAGALGLSHPRKMLLR